MGTDYGESAVQVDLRPRIATELRKFCARVGLTQPAVIRTLIFNLLGTQVWNDPEERTVFGKSMRASERVLHEYTGTLVTVNAALAVNQIEPFHDYCADAGVYPGMVLRTLIRHLTTTIKPGTFDSAFLWVARRLMSRVPSSPLWGDGCQFRDPDGDVARGFVRQHRNLTAGTTAAAMRCLGLRHSARWVKRTWGYH